MKSQKLQATQQFPVTCSKTGFEAVNYNEFILRKQI